MPTFNFSKDAKDEVVETRIKPESDMYMTFSDRWKIEIEEAPPFRVLYFRQFFNPNIPDIMVGVNRKGEPVSISVDWLKKIKKPPRWKHSPGGFPFVLIV